MPTDPMLDLLTRTSPQLEAGGRQGDIERRLRAQEAGGGGSAAGYGELPYVSTGGTTTPSWQDPPKLFVPDRAGEVVEVFASSLLIASFGGTALVTLLIEDEAGTVKAWTILQLTQPNPPPGTVWLFTAPGGQGAQGSGSWIVFPREILSSVGLKLDGVLTFRLRFQITGGPQGEFYETRLWVRRR